MPHNLKCSQMMDVQMDEKLTGKCENDWSMNNSVTFTKWHGRLLPKNVMHTRNHTSNYVSKTALNKLDDGQLDVYIG